MAKFLEGKVAIVTGSGQGVGRSIAFKLAEAGAKVITNNRHKNDGSHDIVNQADLLKLSPEELVAFEARLEQIGGDAETTAASIKVRGGEATPFYCDIADFEKAREMVDFAVETYGSIDILVNVAGSFGFGSISELTEEVWDRVNGPKPKGYFNLMRHAVPYMMEQKWGRIINCTSRSAYGDWIKQPEYSAANAGVIGLTLTSAIELYPYNITCNLFEPFARTRASANLEIAASSGVTPGAGPSFEETPHPDSVAPLIAYLASDQAAHISGASFALVGNYIGLYNNISVHAGITKFTDEYWTQEELERAVPMHLLDGYRSIVG